MGWSFAYSPAFKKADQVAEFRGGGFWAAGIKVLDDAVVGNNYWALLERPDGSKTIALNMMKGGGRNSGWGYKGLDETMGPYQYNCPLRLINAAGEPANENAAEWRNKVREYWANQKERRAGALKPQPGMVVEYGGKEYVLRGPAGPRLGWQVDRGGCIYRMKASQLAQAKVVRVAA